jgi:hypothetical protein
MPYASKAQRGYLHAHPEITDKKGHPVAAKWDAEIRRRKRVAKAKAPGWLQPLAIGTAGGALANQLPSFEEQARLRENRRRRKSAAKANVKKNYSPPVWPDDGYFNARAAQQAYDLVMKMDDDTAEMFTTIVVGDILEGDIEANQRTLQKHLNEVVAKRITDLKRATLRAVSKSGGDSAEQVAFAQALAVLERLVSKADDDFKWDPKAHPRGGVNPGWFRSSVSHTQQKPLHPKTAETIGIKRHPAHQDMNDKQRAQYQDEYRQLKGFLDQAYQASPNPGDTKIQLHFRDHDGTQYAEEHPGTRPKPKMLDPRERTLVGMSAQPAGLTLGGAAFGLTSALGGSMSPGVMGGLNTAGQKLPDFAENWTKAGSGANSNERLYNRLETGSGLLRDLTPNGSKANLAGHVGNFVGSYGPQAEAVIGPPARRTAYRYRGTEKKPDPQMVAAYETAIRNSMGNRGRNVEDDAITRRAQNRAIEAKRREVADATKTPVEAVRLTADERVEAMNSARSERRAASTSPNPTFTEQQGAAAEIAAYLGRSADDPRGGAAPRRGLYNLQLASGNTPPSEGVILDRNGKIVTQAIGYGDDHYLPFNLKNLKGLKGGSYIRNRSVGGLTSEDIYTGLVSGARSVTVVSRSGTFTMEFEPDFRGGRRHNDKARRMTRRYEQILDAVQSEQVERQGIMPETRRAIADKVRAEAENNPLMGPNVIRAEVNRRIEEYKANPEIEPEDEEYLDFMTNYQTAGMALDSPERNAIKSNLRNQMAAEKELKFRLNGDGYAAALEGLREQFPYYIKVRSEPTKEGKFEREPDLGYVEPDKIRPTAAAAGLFGAKRQHQYQSSPGKISAAEADYAGGAPRRAAPAPAAPAAEAPEGETTATPEGTAEKTKAAKPETLDPVSQAGYADKAVTVQQAIKSEVAFAPGSVVPPWVRMDEDQFRAHLRDKDNLTRFDQWISQHQEMLASDPEVDKTLLGYHQAAGRIGQKMYEPALNQEWRPKPYRFPDESKAYRPEATTAERQAELKRIGANAVGVVSLKPVASMSDAELQAEVAGVAGVRRKLGSLEGAPDFEDMKTLLTGINRDSPTLASVFRDATNDPKGMDDYLEMVHRTRAVNQAVPSAERGAAPAQEEVVHNPITEKENTVKPLLEKMERIKYLTDHTMRLHAEGTPERKRLQHLRDDLGLIEDEDGTGADELIGMSDAHPEAVDLILHALHTGDVQDWQPAPEPERVPVPRSGPILS